MGKHKALKKETKSFLKAMDTKMNYHYEEMTEEIEEMQKSLKKVDEKAKRRAKKKAKGNKNLYLKYYLTDKDRKKARKEKLEKMEREGLLDIAESTVKDLRPIMQIGSRLIGAFVLAIFSANVLKVYLSEEDFKRLKAIYKACMNV